MLLNGFAVSRHVQALPLAVVCCLALVACGNSAPSAEAPVATAPAASSVATASGSGYEVVLADHPAPADGALQAMRDSAYKFCVATAQLQHMPVKLFPTLPNDYVTQRSTYVSDGSSWMRKVEPVYRVDADNLSPDKGCEVRIVPDKTFEVTIEHAGKQISISGHDDGTTTVDSADDDLGAYNANSTPENNDRYTDARTVAGVNLRCLPKTSAVLGATGIIDTCVYEKAGVVTTSDKKPIVLYSNIRPAGANPNIPYTVISEVTSLKLGAAIDSSAFDAKTYSK